ncbi:MAG: hypothetical protein Q7T89_00365 [Anaerolineales bacterium]|nr:hypothetical protein [Anaerolineales bacterium]
MPTATNDLPAVNLLLAPSFAKHPVGGAKFTLQTPPGTAAGA